ncbi:hypothetical protein [Gordonia otitidis]|uniref:Major facilitator superfamily transporter n=1 Tax=Gordonia otitidis (strain DSM 44809 / CCUG 52243 / JCM 12355 / NBRC 100426 / IFM 10032) TaxID=1108044 RepID=H5TIR2_GORO1|nr:hypothetical protein [Gordonia otitidis]GAB33370.1 putative major facilitator superfamily transporter [Gordonia otitidis NBRC 100426]
MPLAIWVIGLGIFAQGTSELMLAGLLPEMAADLDVTIPQAGGLISSFALGMLVGAPVLAALTLRSPCAGPAACRCCCSWRCSS